MRRLFLLLAASGACGCLLVAAPSPTFTDTDAGSCNSNSCPGGYTCDTALDECAETCSDSPTHPIPCKAGYSCAGGQCTSGCIDADCPGGYACDPDTDRCLTYCDSDSDCHGQFSCCTEEAFQDGLCDDLWGSCYK